MEWPIQPSLYLMVWGTYHEVKTSFSSTAKSKIQKPYNSGVFKLGQKRELISLSKEMCAILLNFNFKSS